ncbi:hypothetical protein SD457_18335 [Coprobacillaceae bacterium CR2/5/TPMF4]|nr:hypothetical protein SD457_18335 [Coprobacillaceae bacterium CR2/5/TPMF4]
MIFQYIDRMEKGIDIVENNIIKIVNYSKKENIYGGEVDLWSEVLSEFNKEAKKMVILLVLIILMMISMKLIN